MKRYHGSFLQRKFFWGVQRHFLSDEAYARQRYQLELGKSLRLGSPKTFTEKIQWLKLYERQALRRCMANRLQARKFITERVGSEHLVPLHASFEKLTEAEWQQLPECFVLKANHGCEMVHIVRSKANASPQKAVATTRRWQSTNYATVGREWVYDNLPRPILAEKLLLTNQQYIPKDYKFFCFDGCVRLVQVDFDRFSNQKRNLYDRDFNRVQGQLLYPNYEHAVQAPPHFERAVAVAEKLSQNFNFIRVDLYLMPNGVFVGELTNFPGGGFVPFQPEALERKMGDLLRL